MKFIALVLAVCFVFVATPAFATSLIANDSSTIIKPTISFVKTSPKTSVLQHFIPDRTNISIVGDLEQLNRHGFDGKANLITGIEIVPIWEVKF
ncbi:MAG TPA: hypothetical protein ENH85_01170 [Candidatus Scalindua sp.]|nr:hypothetical protein [Candidatus Scalindua sp.]